MHNHDDKYPDRLGFEPGTSRLQAPVDTKEPFGPDLKFRKKNVLAKPLSWVVSQSGYIPVLIY